MKTNVYIVHYNEEEYGEVMDNGVCDVVYLNEDDAITQMWKLSDDKMDELLDDYEEDKIYRDVNGDDYIVVHSPFGTYEYFVSCCYFINK